MEETIELYQLSYSDLITLSSDQNPSSSSSSEIQRLELISQKIIQNLGRNGPGLLSVSGVPKAQIFRQTLLPLARKLALLNHNDQKRILKEHDLGSDVSLKNPNRIVSSFAMQMKYDHDFDVDVSFKGNVVDRKVGDGEFGDLRFAFRGLGVCMMELGLCLARVCDKMIGGCELERSLLECGTGKGRLIHYHSFNDNVGIRRDGGDVDLVKDRKMDLWQQWHYDYGVFTILTSPMFMLTNGGDENECESPSGHTYLQVFRPEMNRVFNVKVGKGSFIVQVGESADMLSKGRLRATLHSVCRPVEMDDLSRETFVVFLQPAWSKIFSLSDYPVELSTLGDKISGSCSEGVDGDEVETNGLSREIRGIVPPLCSRLRDGMTFAEFAKETTKQYYGGSGLQSNKQDKR